MTSRRVSMANSGIVRATVATASAIAGLVVVGVSSGEDGLRSSFQSALQSAPHGPTFERGQPPVAGSEEFWLTTMGDPRIAPVAKAVSVGDRIAMRLNGEGHTFEVQSVADFAPQVTAIDTTSGPSRFVLVTARDVAVFEARPVRFVMEVFDRGPSLARGGRKRAL